MPLLIKLPSVFRQKNAPGEPWDCLVCLGERRERQPSSIKRQNTHHELHGLTHCPPQERAVGRGSGVADTPALPNCRGASLALSLPHHQPLTCLRPSGQQHPSIPAMDLFPGFPRPQPLTVASSCEASAPCLPSSLCRVPSRSPSGGEAQHSPPEAEAKSAAPGWGQAAVVAKPTWELLARDCAGASVWLLTGRRRGFH